MFNFYFQFVCLERKIDQQTILLLQEMRCLNSSYSVARISKTSVFVNHPHHNLPCLGLCPMIQLLFKYVCQKILLILSVQCADKLYLLVALGSWSWSAWCNRSPTTNWTCWQYHETEFWTIGWFEPISSKNLLLHVK